MSTSTGDASGVAVPAGSGSPPEGPPGGGLSGLFALSQTLGQSLSTGSAALSALQSQWQGDAAQSAAATGQRLEEDKAAVKSQGEQIAATVRVGAGIINHGNMLLQAVATKLATTLAALAPAAFTPPGQIAIMSAISSATAETQTIIAATEAELIPPTQHLLAIGRPHDVTMPPGVDAGQLPQLGEIAQQVMGPAQQVAQTAGDAVTDLVGTGTPDAGGRGLDPFGLLRSAPGVGDTDPGTASSYRDLLDADLASAWSAGDAGAGGAGGDLGGIAGGLAGASMIGAAGLAGMAGAMSAMSAPGGLDAAAAAPRPVAAPAGGQPMMMPPPMGAGAGAAGRGGDDSHKTPEFLVTAAHGDEIVGDQPDVAPGVLGGMPHPGEPGVVAHGDDDGVDSTTLNM